MNKLTKVWRWISNIGINPETPKVEVLRLRLMNRLISVCLLLTLFIIFIALVLQKYDLILINFLFPIFFPIGLYLNHKGKYKLSRHLMATTIFIAIFLPPNLFILNYNSYLFGIPVLSFIYFIFPKKESNYYLVIGILSIGLSTFTQDYGDGVLNVNDIVNIYTSVMVTFLVILLLKQFRKENNIYIQTIQEQQFDLESAQNIAKIGSWVYNFNTNFFNVSNQICTMFNLPTQANYTFWEITTWVLPPKQLLSLRKQISKIEDNSHYEFLFHKSDTGGSKKWYRLIGERLDDETGHPIKLIGTIQDITDRVSQQERIEQLVTDLTLSNEQLKKQQKHLQLSNKELEQFVYVVSHDLQEPLRMVGNFIQLLEEELEDLINEEQKEYIDYAVDGVTRMSKLMDDLLKYSRVGKSKMDKQLFDPSKLMAYKIHDLSIKIKETNAIVQFDDLPPQIYGEPNQLGIVFYNLINNGIKFNNSPTPSVQIKGIEKDEHYLFTIKDNGIGIDEKNHKKIFEVFKRLHRKEIYKGTGIGLALVKRIIIRHNGKIWLESKLKQGTTFFFTIPKK